MGRLRDASVQHFRIFKKDDLVYERAQCLYCKKEMASNISKLKVHLEKCVQYQETATESASTQRYFSKRRHVDVVTYATAEDQKNFEHKLSAYIFGDGVPLSVVDSPRFQNLLATTNPHYKMPTRKSLSDGILDENYEHAFKMIETEIRDARSLSLIFDAWTDVCHQPVVGFVITTPKPFFWKAFHTEDTRHTTDFFVEKCSNIIDQFGAHKFTAVVTDNASTMVKTRKVLEAKYPGIACYGCLAHVLNLLVGDIFKIPLPKDTMTKCTAVIHFFNRSALCDMIFQKKRAELSISRDLVEPVLTRWASQVSCLESFIINRPSLQLAMLDETIASKIDSDLKKVILSDDFFIEISRLHNILSPLRDLIGVVESKKSAISIAITHYQAFWKLSTELDASVSYKEGLVEYISHRWNMFYHPILLLALRLDPKVDGGCIPSIISENDDIAMIIKQLVPNETKRNRTFQQYFQYRAREGPFLSKDMWTVMGNVSIDSTCWWKACFSDIAPELCDLAIRVLNAPVSSAEIERTFSAYGYIHNSSRNRLTPVRSEKLVFLYHNLKELDMASDMTKMTDNS